MDWASTRPGPCCGSPTWAGSWGRSSSRPRSRTARRCDVRRHARLAGSRPTVGGCVAVGRDRARCVANVIRSLMRQGTRWPQAHDLGSSTAIGSTGEPWNLDPWMWCFRHVGNERVPIVNISGGTECGGSLVSGSVLLPDEAHVLLRSDLGRHDRRRRRCGRPAPRRCRRARRPRPVAGYDEGPVARAGAVYRLVLASLPGDSGTRVISPTPIPTGSGTCSAGPTTR